MGDVDVLIKNAAKLGEGPVYDQIRDELLFVDIDGCSVNIYNFKSGITEKIKTDGRVGMAVYCDDENKILCAVENGLYFYNRNTKIFEPYITDIFNDDSKRMRFNDGKCDRYGRLYVGSLDFSGENKSKLYMTEKGRIKIIEENLGISNGIAFDSQDRYMFFNDTSANIMYRYEYNKSTGDISGRIDFINFNGGRGGCDGMTIDADDNLMVAMWGGYCMRKYDFGGKFTEEISVPTAKVTSAVFGGSCFDIMYITSAEDSDSPLSGSVFSNIPSSHGVPSYRFNIT